MTGPRNFKEALMVWLQIAAYSFGGPTNQIAVMHKLLVEEKKWVSEEQFLHALNYCMLLPGPEAHQLVIYMAWLFHRALGGIIAGSLFVLPGFISILLLSILYVKYQNLTFVQGLFYGLKPAVIAIVFVALVKIGRKTLTGKPRMAIAGLAFIGLFFLKISFPFIIFATGLIGYLGGKFCPSLFNSVLKTGDNDRQNRRPDQAVKPLNILMIALFWIVLWIAPTITLMIFLGTQNVFSQEGILFSKVAAISFGGAYAVLAYVAQKTVQTYHWLTPSEMLDGLGMAETTPGPLIQVLQFVGFIAAYRNPGNLDALTAAILAAVLTTWVTFVPSFIWIFAGAPYIEKLRHNQALNTAMSGITAAVVGVIFNLALWFALHTLFARIEEASYFGVHLPIPEPETFQIIPFFLTISCIILLMKYKASLFMTLFFSVAVGLLLSWL